MAETKKIRVWVRTSKVQSLCETEIEVEADLEDEALEEAAKDAMFEMINWSYEEVESEESD